MGKDELISEEGLRIDGRRAEELRNIKCKLSVAPDADGSAFYQQGHTEVIATVYGPMESKRRNAAHDRAIINCEYLMAPFSTAERKNTRKGDRRSTEIALLIKQTFEAIVLCELAPRSQIDIFVSVIQADGGTRCAAINAVTLALIDAGIPMREFVCSCAAGFVNGTAILDLNYVEDSSGADLPIALLPQSGKITMLQMDSKLRLDEFEQVMHLAVEGCKKLHVLLLESVKQRTEALIESRGVFRS